MNLKGGSLKVSNIKAFLESSYNPDPPKDLMGYILDDKLSGLYGKVYFNNNLKKVVLIFRGTGSENHGEDWLNNGIYATNTGAYTATPRYKEAKQMTNKALKNIKAFNLNFLDIPKAHYLHI